MIRNIYTCSDIVKMDMSYFKLWTMALKTGCLFHIGIRAKKYTITSDPKTGDIWLDYEEAK